MAKLRLPSENWDDYLGSSIRFEKAIGLFVIRREVRVFFAKTIDDAFIVAKFLEISCDPELSAMRVAISQGLSADELRDFLVSF